MIVNNLKNSGDLIHYNNAYQNRNKMEVACLIDLSLPENLIQRKQAFEVIQSVCKNKDLKCSHIQFKKLDFGEMNVLDIFYNADIVLIDLSFEIQQRSLFYHLGVRESFGMKKNILLYNDCDADKAKPLKLTYVNYPLIFYKTNNSGACVATLESKAHSVRDEEEFKLSLHQCLETMLEDVEIQSKAYMKERFLEELRKAREKYSGEALVKILHNLRKRLDDPNLLSGDIILNMLLSFRDVQDYDAMVQLVNDLLQVPQTQKYLDTAYFVNYLHAFALSRRNLKGDREKALEIMQRTVESLKDPVPDMICLCGRIYKDKYIESGHKDREALNKAIYWYRKGFEAQPNEYAGINLATLLVINGSDFHSSSELQHIGLVLNNLIGRKGSLSSLEDYWDVATFFEISVLEEDYGKAIQAAQCMFQLKPPIWYLKSTIGNILLINNLRRKEKSQISNEEQTFNFWMDYFMEAVNDNVDETIHFPVLHLQPHKIYIPSYVTVNLNDEEKSLKLWHIEFKHLQQNHNSFHEFLFTASQIKGVSLYKKDERCIFLYVYKNADDFQLFLPSPKSRLRFYNLILELTADQPGTLLDFNNCEEIKPIRYDYEYDESGKPVILGRGTFGIVYAAWDLDTQVRIAVKEVPENNLGILMATLTQQY